MRSDILLPLIGRRNRYAAFSKNWRRHNGDPKDYLDAHLSGLMRVGTIHGGEPTTRLMAVDIDGSSHDPTNNAPETLNALLDVATPVGLTPSVVFSSKSGTGFHVYFLLDQELETLRAAFYMRWLKRQLGRRELDCLYPSSNRGDGTVLSLPWFGLFATSNAARTSTGGVIVAPASLVPVSDQARALSEAPRLSPNALNIEIPANAPPSSATQVPDQKDETNFLAPNVSYHRKPGFRDLDILQANCKFIRFAETTPERLSYKSWFSLATVLRVFDGGPSLFDEISRKDPTRYRPGEPVAKIESVNGRPRHCRNLGWSCPDAAKCETLNVRSPAGLPFKLRRYGRLK